nr:MAG TPA: hypothetical protein [Caudoviricetes sp.]
MIRFPDVLAPIQHRVKILQFELRFLPYISIYSYALFIHDFSFLKCRKFQSVRAFLRQNVKKSRPPDSSREQLHGIGFIKIR